MENRLVDGRSLDVKYSTTLHRASDRESVPIFSGPRAFFRHIFRSEFATTTSYAICRAHYFAAVSESSPCLVCGCVAKVIAKDQVSVEVQKS